MVAGDANLSFGRCASLPPLSPPTMIDAACRPGSNRTMRAKLFRQKAKECAALANTMTDQLSRWEFERMAAHWLQLAEGADLLKRPKDQHGER